MIDFEAIEDALFSWVKTATGLADDFIIFDSQDGVSPIPNPYVTIRIGDLVNIGVDASEHDYDSSAPAGEEIIFNSNGMRDLTVTLMAFTPATVGNATARNLAAKCQAFLALDSVLLPLNIAGLGVLDAGNVRWVPKLDDTDFEGRAILDVRFCVAQSASDTTGYIATVTGPTGTIDS